MNPNIESSMGRFHTCGPVWIRVHHAS